VHESGSGTKLPIRDVRNPVTNGGRPDVARIALFGRDPLRTSGDCRMVLDRHVIIAKAKTRVL
jgi:hypothetical protein